MVRTLVRGVGLKVSSGALLLCLGVTPLRAQIASSSEKLSEFDFLLLGLSVRPDPEIQVVPKGTPTGVRVAIELSGSSAGASSILPMLPAGLEVAGELVGPGITSPLPLRGPPGEILPIPPLAQRGLYLLRDLRLERNGELFLRAIPDTATIQVIDSILITQVTTRPLTAEEIRQRGILIGDDDFTGFNFTLALKLDSKPVIIDFPVLFDSNDVPIPIRPAGGLALEGASFSGLGTAGFLPLMLDVELPEGEEISFPELADVHIPGLLVIPGEVGFLNQFFSALLIVSNGAPNGSGLTVRALEATVGLPPGEDQVSGTDDDPLEVAETATGQASLLPVLGVGADGISGTADDTSSLGPGEQGQAEFLLEGRREGFHTIDFDIEGTLEGLPIGPVPVRGHAKGGVLVRNPFFNMTFIAPATVRAGEEFTLFVTVTNVSQALANFLTVSLNEASLSGATLLGESTAQVETLAPGDSEVLSFRFRSGQTGQVTASYLRFQDAGETTGTLLFSLGVGERGIPLSPDTLVLPSSAEALPASVVEAALRVLGQAWSIATAPAGTLPPGVTRLSKSEVLDRAQDLAEAGLRIQLGETSERALTSVAFRWLRTSEPGFDQLLRKTEAGGDFLAALGAAIDAATTLPSIELHRALSAVLGSQTPHVLIALGSGTDSAPITWTLRDDRARALTPLAASTAPNTGFLAFGGDAGRGLALATEPADRYEMTFTATAEGSLDLSASLSRADGAIGFHPFGSILLTSGLRGKLTIDRLSPTAPVGLLLDRDGDGVFEETVPRPAEEVFPSGGPKVLAATAIGPETLNGADPWGRVVAVLFDRELRATEAERISTYRIENNEILAATRQPSGRLVFLFLRDPVGRFIERRLTVTGVFDASGKPMSPFSVTLPVGSRIADPGAIVSGRVLRADGGPLTTAQVIYLNATANGLAGISLKNVHPDGSYSFDYVRQSPIGPFAIRAIDPETGGIRELTTSVRADGEHIVIDLVLLGRGGVTGTVRDLLGEPVPGARVLVTSQSDPASFDLVETDGSGRYQATGILVGPVAVKAVLETSSGVASGNIQRAGTFATVDVTINLNAGRVSGGVFEIDAELGGTVRPVPMSQVYFLIPNPQTTGDLVVASSETASDGQYAFDNMPSGLFRILAIDRVTGRQSSTENLTLPPGGALQNVDVFFRSEAVGGIEGLVRTASGAVASGVPVTTAGRQTLTDEAGRFAFAEVPIGAQTVVARHPTNNLSASVHVNVLQGLVTEIRLTLPGAGQVSVTVLDTAGQPMAGQSVLFVRGGPCLGIERFTDSSGVALFDDVPVPGGFFKAVRSDDVAQGTALIQREGDRAELTLRFAGFGTVRGKVLDDQGDPVLGADVVLGARRLDSEVCSFVEAPRAQQVRTGPDGTFAFVKVPIGSVSVTAANFFFPVPASARDVLLTDGEVKDFTLQLTSTIAGKVSGTIFLPDGETPAGSGVSVTASSPTFPDTTVTTGPDGRFAFAKIFPAGRYTLTASDPVSGSRAQRIISLLADQDLTADLRLLGRGTVEVTVLDGAGEPIEEAFVELTGAGFPFDRHAGAITPDDGGVIRFENVSEGSFTVVASDPLGRGGRASGNRIGAGTTTAITVSLTVTGTVRGVYTTSDGSTPIPNAEVRLRQGTTGRLLGSTTTSSPPGSTGRFEFLFVPAGTVLATATDPLTGRIGEASGKIVSEGEVIEMAIRQLGQGSVSGSVTEGGAPMPGAVVELRSSTGLSSTVPNLEATATTGSEGQFHFEGVPVGTFTLRATVPGLLLTGMASRAIETDGQTVSGIEIALESSGTIRGAVLRADATTLVPGAELMLDTRKGRLRDESNATGAFSFELVPTGDFTLTAQDPGTGDGGRVLGALGEGEEIDVDVVFNGVGRVEGTAFDSDGMTALSAGLVQLTRPAPFARSETATVAPDGSFHFQRIPVGEFTLSLTLPGSPLRGTAMGSVPADGETILVDIQLAEAGSVVGRILRSDGETPAANVLVRATGPGFTFSELTGAAGGFRFEGIPLGSFTVRAEDSVAGGVALATGSVQTNGETVDLGTLLLDDSPIAVASVTPEAGALVPPDSHVVVRFTDPTTPSSLAGRFLVRKDGSSLSGVTTLSADGLEATFTPATVLPPRSMIDVLVSKEVTDTLGRKLGTDFMSTFETSGAVVTGAVLLGVNTLPGAEVILTAGGESRTTPADSEGQYRFEDVPVGIATVQAVDSTSGQAGSAVVDIGPDDGLLRRDIVLGFTGNVSGKVTRFDGTDGGPGLEVVIVQSSTAVAVTTTDATSSYLVTNIPLGDFEVDVTNPVDGDRGRNAGTLSAVGITVDVPVQMLGIGSVRLVVEDATGQVIPNAEGSIRFTRFGETTTLEEPLREIDGSLLFPSVLAGPFTAHARDPVTELEVFAGGDVLPAQETRLVLVLEPTGSLSGRVVAPDGATPVAGASVQLFRGNNPFPLATATSAVDGTFQFTDLPAATNYQITVHVDDRIRARRRNVEVVAGEVTFLELQLVGLGTVRGTVIPPTGETLSSSVSVTLHSLAPDVGGVFSDPNAADGAYEITNVPVGAFRLSARDIGNGFLGEAAGTIAGDGQIVEIDIQLIDNAITFPASGLILPDGNNARYRVLQRGALDFDQHSLFSSSGEALNLEVGVNGGASVAFVGLSIGSQEETGRELATAVQEIDGIRVQRKIFVPPDGYFARYLEIFENPSALAASATATLVSNLSTGGSFNGNLELSSTSSGDSLLDSTDFWAVTDDAKDEDPFETTSSGRFSTAWVWAGDSASSPSLLELQSSGVNGTLAAQYEITIPANGRVLLMHFVSQQIVRDSADAAAERLSQLPPEALAGLSLDEIAGVLNFDVPPDGVSALEPLPPLDGKVFGQLLAHDGATGVGTSTGSFNLNARFKSDHILYRRAHDVPADAKGNFSLEPRFATTLGHRVIPRVGFTLQSSRSVGSFVTSASASGSFTGRSLLSRAVGAELTASSESSTSFDASRAADGSVSTFWQPASGVTSASLTLTVPVAVSVDTLRIVSASGAMNEQVQIDLLGSSGELLDSRTESFPTPDSELVVVLDPPMTGVRQVFLLFSGNPIRVAELEILGTTTADLGSAVQNLVFTGSAGISLTTRRASGEGIPSSIFTRSVPSGVGAGSRNTDSEGFLPLLAPLPVGSAPIDVTATALSSGVGHSFLRTTVRAELTADTTTVLDIHFPETASISGQVLGASGEPAAGQSVIIFTSLTSTSSTTDAGGNYAFSDLPAGDYTLRIFSNNRILDTAVRLDPPVSLVRNLQIPAFGTVVLTALIETAPGDPVQPAAGAPVTIIDSLGTRSFGLVTNASGRVSIGNTAGGSFTLQIRHPHNSFSTTTASGSIDADGQVLEITVILPAFGHLNGTVFLGNGTTPAGFAPVSVSGASIEPRSTTANGSGIYVLQNVQALRPFTLTARHPSTSRRHIFTEVDGEISGQGRTELIDLTLPKTGTLEVSVTEADGEPISNASVSVKDSFSADFRFEGTTSAAGKRTIVIVPEGTFVVRAEKSGSVIGEATGEILAHDELVPVTITRAVAVSIEGTVFAADGETPVGGARVELRTANGLTLLGSTTADSDGIYRFEDAFPAGESRTVRAVYSGTTTQTVDEVATSDEPGTTLTVDLTLPITAITGQVLEAGGSTPVPNASVEIVREGTFEGRTATAGEEGFFAIFDVLPGRFELRAHDDFGLIGRTSLELLEGASSARRDVLLPEHGIVEGHVTDAFGSPVDFQSVHLVNANVTFARTTFTDAAGFYRFERAALGSFTVTSEDFTDLGPVPGATSGRLSFAGETVAADIAWPQTGNVLGQLLTPGGLPTPPASASPELTLENRSVERSSGIFARDGFLSTADGTYFEEEIPVGDVTVTIEDGDTTGAAAETLAPGEEKEIDVPLGTAVSHLPLEFLPGLTDGIVRVRGDGVLEGTDQGESFELSAVRVNSKSYPRLASGVSEPSDQMVLGPARVSGLDYTRKILVFPGRRVIRILDVLENPGSFDVDAALILSGEHEDDVLAPVLNPAESFFFLQMPLSAAVVYAGEGGVERPEAARGDDSRFELEWRGLVVPAGGRLILMHFAVQAEDFATSQALVESLVQLSDPNLFSDLTAEERSQVVNFVVPQP